MFIRYIAPELVGLTALRLALLEGTGPGASFIPDAPVRHSHECPETACSVHRVSLASATGPDSSTGSRGTTDQAVPA